MNRFAVDVVSDADDIAAEALTAWAMIRGIVVGDRIIVFAVV